MVAGVRSMDSRYRTGDHDIGTRLDCGTLWQTIDDTLKQQGYKDGLETEASASAAAPEMLEALRMMLRLMEGENLDEQFDGEAEVLRDALAKAEGR